VEFPRETNVIKKEAEKILKYKVLITEIQRMWNVKAYVLAVIIGRLVPFQYHSDNTWATYIIIIIIIIIITYLGKNR
jgi:hypothetical protein